MGFLSKVWKGTKKVFKKIGKGIDKVFKKFGKFMGKIGWLGQIAMVVALPSIGSLMANGLGRMMKVGKGISSLGGLLANMSGSSNGFVRTAGIGLKAGYKVISDVTRPFTSIVSAVAALGKTTVNKVSDSIFGVTPFNKSALKYEDAFTSIRDDFSNMYNEKRWDTLEKTTSNSETLNELQAMSDEQLANLGYSKGSLEGASAVAEGFINANIDDSKYQYTEFDSDSIAARSIYKDFSGAVRGRDVYEETKSLLKADETPVSSVPLKTEETEEETFMGDVRKKIAEVPGNVFKDSAEKAIDYHMNKSKQEEEEAGSGFGPPSRISSIGSFVPEETPVDPYALMYTASQAGDRKAESFFNGPNYGGWDKWFKEFSPVVGREYSIGVG